MLKNIQLQNFQDANMTGCTVCPQMVLVTIPIPEHSTFQPVSIIPVSLLFKVGPHNKEVFCKCIFFIFHNMLMPDNSDIALDITIQTETWNLSRGASVYVVTTLLAQSRDLPVSFNGRSQSI